MLILFCCNLISLYYQKINTFKINFISNYKSAYFAGYYVLLFYKKFPIFFFFSATELITSQSNCAPINVSKTNIQIIRHKSSEYKEKPLDLCSTKHLTKRTADVPFGRKSSIDISGNIRPILDMTSSTYLEQEKKYIYIF